jgi:hypothetical protein
MKVFMKKILIVILGIFSIPLYSQINDSITTINKVRPNLIRDTNVKIEFRFSHRYPTSAYEHRNIKLSRYRNDIIQLDSLTDDGKLVYSVECYVDVREFQMTMIGDSMSIQTTNKNILGADSTYPSEIIVYSLVLIRHGEYKEYHQNGNVKKKGLYWNNLKHKKWKEYDGNGKLIKVNTYKKGVLKSK